MMRLEVRFLSGPPRKENMNWQEIFDKGQELMLATCSSDAQPNANVVISLGFVDGKLLIADSQMNKTLENIKTTKLICIIAKKGNCYYRAKGIVEIHNSGKYFDICKEADKEYPPKHAILVTIGEVFDLDKQILLVKND